MPSHEPKQSPEDERREHKHANEQVQTEVFGPVKAEASANQQGKRHNAEDDGEADHALGHDDLLPTVDGNAEVASPRARAEVQKVVPRQSLVDHLSVVIEQDLFNAAVQLCLDKEQHGCPLVELCQQRHLTEC